MPEAKKPQDHKKSKEELDHFSFEHDGKTYEFEGSLKVTTSAGFIRRSRNKDEIDVLFSLFEEIAGDDALAAIDEMDLTSDEFKELSESFGEALQAYQGASLGES